MIANAHKRIDYSPLRPARRGPSAGGGAAAVWTPHAGPQHAAYESHADIIGYGGAAGGGKTDLALGLAGMRHTRSIILRREFPQVRGIIERSREIFNNENQAHGKDSYNESLHLWRLATGQSIELGACQYEKNKEDFRGRPYDLHVFDEATQFTESIVRFIMAWNRTTKPGQHCQVVLTFNPPTDTAGRWVIRYFLPWMAYLFPTLDECKGYTGIPAKPGDLRWFSSIGGVDTEVPEGTRNAKSRTFFPARVEDNPDLMAQGYDATLEALPEPLRSQMRYGNFTAGMESDPWQVIPTDWVHAAQKRWTAQRPVIGLRSIGCDVARGGKDSTVIAEFVGNWCAPLIKKMGVETPDGPSVATLLAEAVTSKTHIAIDIIGVGGSAYDTLKTNKALVMPVNNSSSAPEGATDRTKTLKFRNVRAASYWKLREAFDPEHGENIALPPDPELVADLTAGKWSLTTAGIQIEDKDDIKKRIGRSPDCADALALAHYGVWARPKPPPIVAPMGATQRSGWNR